MSRNGTGLYALPAGNPVVAGTTISDTTFNATLSDIASAITGSLAANGETQVTGNIPMAGFKITSLGAGAAVGDAVNFGQLSASSGSGAIGYDATSAGTAGSVGAKLHDWVSPTDYPWLADKTGATDSVAAIMACYAWCKANGKKMRWVDGTYTLNSAPYTFTLPRDDGSYAPSIGGGETTIAAETAVTMPVALYFDGSVEMEGESLYGVILQGAWNYLSDTVSTAQTIGVLLGSTMDGTTTQFLRNLTIKKFMVPYVVQGILTNGEISINVDSCGTGGIFQGTEGNTKIEGRIIRTYAGNVIGGWWMTRNRTTAVAYLANYAGTYPAADIYRLGWSDNLIVPRLEKSISPDWSARFTQLDSWFDTNWFKSANSAIYPAGRATVNASADFVGYATYRGICGFAQANYSRNGRYCQRHIVGAVVTNGHQRPAIYYSHARYCSGGTWYNERIGLVTVSGSLSAGNLFGVDQVDPYHAGQPVASGIWIENDVANRFDHMFASNCASGLVSGTSLLSWRMESQFDALYVGSFRTGVKIGNNGADAALDRYAKGTASPTLKGSTTAGANTYTENTLRYTLVGNRVYFSIRISLTSKDGAMAGNISIAGLPIAAAAGGHIVGVAVPVFENTTLTAGYTVLGGWIAAGASEIILWQSGTGVSRLNLAAAAISSTTSLYLDGHYEI